METISLQEIWREVLEQIQETEVYSPEVFQDWIASTSLLQISQQSACVGCPSAITVNIIRQNREKFDQALSGLLQRPVTIELVTGQEARRFVPTAQITDRIQRFQNTKFRPEYTFDSFVEGSSNREAFTACWNSVLQTGACTYNPIMLYGNSGLGKTHLLHAVGNFLQASRPEVKVIYMYAQTFVDLLYDAFKTQTTEEVKKYLTDCDYFLLDDIQNLKQGSLEVFFSVYNDLFEKDTQIIITSDQHPSQIEILADRLISRFSGGLLISISKPEFNTSRAILQKKIEGKEDEICIQEDVIDYLASAFSNDVRSLEGNLNKLLFNATLEKPEVIDMEFARKVLNDAPVPLGKNSDLTVQKIKKAVIRFYGLSYSDLEGKSRQKALVNARHICVFLARELLAVSYGAIGQSLGGRDHTTIASSYDRARMLIAKDEVFAQAVEKIKSSLQ